MGLACSRVLFSQNDEILGVAGQYGHLVLGSISKLLRVVSIQQSGFGCALCFQATVAQSGRQFTRDVLVSVKRDKQAKGSAIGLGRLEADITAFVHMRALAFQHAFDAMRGDLLFDFGKVVEVVANGVVHRRGAQVRVRVQDVVDGIACAVHLCDQSHGDARTAHDSHTFDARDVRVLGMLLSRLGLSYNGCGHADIVA